jgi:hypothetical protein
VNDAQDSASHLYIMVISASQQHSHPLRSLCGK